MAKFNAQAVVKEDYKETIQAKNTEKAKREISILCREIREFRVEIKKIEKKISEYTQIKEALKIELSNMRNK